MANMVVRNRNYSIIISCAFFTTIALIVGGFLVYSVFLYSHWKDKEDHVEVLQTTTAEETKTEIEPEPTHNVLTKIVKDALRFLLSLGSQIFAPTTSKPDSNVFSVVEQ